MSLKITNESMECCLVEVGRSFTCSSIVSKQRSKDKDMKDLEVRRDALWMLILFMPLVLFLHPTDSVVSDHPRTDPRQAEYILMSCEATRVLSCPQHYPKFFLMVDLKYLRGRSFLCSEKISSPAVLTVIPLRQHSVTLSRNLLNIYVHLKNSQASWGEIT